MNLGPTLVTLGAILGKKSHFYGLKSPIFVTIWSLRTNIEIYIKIDFYLMREYAQCAPAGLRSLNYLNGYSNGNEIWQHQILNF